MFTARRYDSEIGLYYYRARYYAPEIGRFLQTDPIRYRAGLNLYTYCGNNPINWIDPWGLKKYSEAETDAITQEATTESGKSLSSHYNCYKGGGTYDYKANDPDSTFTVDGGEMSASEYGNYLAGYTSYYNYGYTGLYATYVFGDIYSLVEYGTYDDEDSTDKINQGAYDAEMDKNIKKGSE